MHFEGGTRLVEDDDHRVWRRKLDIETDKWMYTQNEQAYSLEDFAANVPQASGQWMRMVSKEETSFGRIYYLRDEPAATAWHLPRDGDLVLEQNETAAPAQEEPLRASSTEVPLATSGGADPSPAEASAGELVFLQTDLPRQPAPQLSDEARAAEEERQSKLASYAGWEASQLLGIPPHSAPAVIKTAFLAV